MQGAALLCACACLATVLRPGCAAVVGNLAPFGPSARNYSTSASRVYSYFPQNSTSKQIGVDVSPFGTVKVGATRSQAVTWRLSLSHVPLAVTASESVLSVVGAAQQVTPATFPFFALAQSPGTGGAPP